MRKRVLKGVVCTVLSVVMATGTTVMASSKEQTKLNTFEKVEHQSKIGKEVLNKKVTAQRSSKIIRNESNKEWIPQIDYDYKTDKIVEQNRTDKNFTNWIVDTVGQNKDMIVHIKMPKAGTLYVDFINTDSEEYLRYADVTLYKGNNKLLSGTQKSGTVRYNNATRGSYTMVIRCNQADVGYGVVYPYYITSEDIGLSTNLKCVVGTGKKLTQSFSIKSRRQVWIEADKAKTGYIEQKVKNKWKRVSDNNYFYTSKKDSIVKSYYALGTGNYRFVMQPSLGTIVNVRYGSKACSTKYATKQSKAKQIKYKKKATNLLTASDKKGTTHYYKIYVNKKKKVNILFNTYQTSGKMKVTVYGKNLKTISRTLVANHKNYKMTGTIRKGTYYIKITKSTANTNGKYEIQYK